MYNDSVLIPAVLYLMMFVVLLFVYPLGKKKIAELQVEKRTQNANNMPCKADKPIRFRIGLFYD